MQIHHSHQLHTVFKDGVVVVVCKEVWYDVAADETALFIKWYCPWTVAGSDLQNGILLPVFLNDKINQGFGIPFALVFWDCGNIFDFKDAFTFIGYDTLEFNAVISQYLHLTRIQITVYHIFLLVCQQQQSKVFFFVFYDLNNSHCLYQHPYPGES